MPRPVTMLSGGFAAFLAAIAIAIALIPSASEMAQPAPAHMPSPQTHEVQTQVLFPWTTSHHLIDAILVALETTMDETAATQRVTYAMGREGAIIISELKPTEDAAEAKSRIQNHIQKLTRRLSRLAESEGMTIKPLAESHLLYLTVCSPEDLLSDPHFYNFDLHVILRSIAKTPGIAQALILGSPMQRSRMTLDRKRLEAAHVTGTDIFRSLESPGVLGPYGPLREAIENGVNSGVPVVISLNDGFVKPFHAYEDAIIQANAEGEILRLRDLATFDLVPEYPSHGDIVRHESGRSFPVVVAALEPDVEMDTISHDLQKILKDIPLSAREGKITFQFDRSLPASIGPLSDAR